MALTEHEILRQQLLNNASGSNDQISTTSSYTTVNYSGEIVLANIPQDLALSVPNRDRLTIQNLDSTDVLLVGIGENAVSGRAYEIEPRGSIVIDVGEAGQRISVLSAKAGLLFVAIGVLKS